MNANALPAYFSRYVPSPRLHRMASKHRVRVVHVPFRRIPAALRQRARYFHFAWVTERQWEAIVQRVAEGRSGWRG